MHFRLVCAAITSMLLLSQASSDIPEILLQLNQPSVQFLRLHLRALQSFLLHSLSLLGHSIDFFEDCFLVSDV